MIFVIILKILTISKEINEKNYSERVIKPEQTMEETGKVVKELFLREKPIPGIFVNKIHPTFMILITFMLFKLSLALKN